MVNRSKPSLAVRRLNENRRSSLSLENSVIKSQNLALAKQLADSKQKNAELYKEIVAMRSKLFEVESLNTKLTEIIKRIDSYGRFSLAKLLGLSDDVTQILQETAQFTCARTLNRVEEVNLQSNKCDSKTRAVKPMISGHTIVRPTITLQRVTTEQLEQLRNSTIINGDGNNSHENEHGDLIASEPTSPLSDEQVSDGNEEEELINNSVNEQSGSNSGNLNRLSTLREESINNITQINNSRTTNDSSNSLHSARFQEARVNLSPLSMSLSPTTGGNYSVYQLNSARNPIVKLHPLPTQQSTNLTPTEQNTNLTPTASSSSRNSTKEICNLQVNLCQLPSGVLRDFSGVNKENVSGNNFAGQSNKQPTEYLLARTHKEDLRRSTTIRGVSSRALLHDVLDNTSIFNDLTAVNSLTKFRDKGIDSRDEDTLEDSLNVSTLVNVSFEASRLSDRFESVEDFTHSNTVNNVTEREEVLRKASEKVRLYNSKKDAPCSSKSSEDLKFQEKSKKDASTVAPVENKTCCGNNSSSDDPLEGPSTLLDSTKSFDEKYLHFNRLGLVPAENNTSTPYTPPKVTIRRKRINPFYSPPTPHLLGRTMLERSVRKVETSPVSSTGESKSRRVSSTNIKPENSSVELYTNCSVNITRLSNRVLTQISENVPAAQVNVKEDPSGRISAKLKTSPSKKKKSQERRKLIYKSSPIKISPRKRRTRCCAPGSLKEPSLHKKLRRSK